MEIVKFAKAVNKYPCSLVFDKSMNPEDEGVLAPRTERKERKVAAVKYKR